MASKTVGFKLNEQTDVEEYFVKQGVHNGFEKIRDLETIKYIRKKPIGFSPKELGELFIEIGNKLKAIRCNIDDIKTTFDLKRSIFDNRQQLVLEMTYKELENND